MDGTKTEAGFWVGLRNFLRPFRGVSKYFLDQYVAFYQAMHNDRYHPWRTLGQVLNPSG